MKIAHYEIGTLFQRLFDKKIVKMDCLDHYFAESITSHGHVYSRRKQYCAYLDVRYGRRHISAQAFLGSKNAPYDYMMICFLREPRFCAPAISALSKSYLRDATPCGNFKLSPAQTIIDAIRLEIKNASTAAR